MIEKVCIEGGKELSKYLQGFKKFSGVFGSCEGSFYYPTSNGWMISKNPIGRVVTVEEYLKIFYPINVKDCKQFAIWFATNWEFHDSTSKGEMYISKTQQGIYSIDDIFDKWLKG